jgi:hypothetical protein
VQEDSCGALLAMHAKLQRVWHWHTRSPTAFFYLVDEATRHLRLSALILSYFSTLKEIFHPGQRGFLLYPTILCSHVYSKYLPYTNYHIYYYYF